MNFRNLSPFVTIFALLSARPVLAQPSDPHGVLSAAEFVQINEPGFGDYQNSSAWSMAWFKGKLYVGTNRDFTCVENATYNPSNYSPQPDPCVSCTPDPNDLDLRAEIWCYTPGNGTWQRVFQSPADLPNPQAPGKFVAEDIGFRNMTVFHEADGTEALYVAGVSCPFIPGLPLPRLLRSTDGVEFAPVPFSLPNPPSSFMGFRAMASYQGKLFMTASIELRGEGFVIVSDNPKAGNFTVASPPGFVAYEMQVFNNLLYIGTADPQNGYSVWKTDASGDPPYLLNPVVLDGAGNPPIEGRTGSGMATVLSMAVFRNKLYVGAVSNPISAYGCEMIRISPDGQWEVVVGFPRRDPATKQWKFPISGLPPGFGNPFNIHIWRMQEHRGVLYAGTNDGSWWARQGIPWYKPEFGFDLFASPDGVHWTLVTRDGFGTGSNFGLRTFASTPVGLFAGCINEALGTSVWLGSDEVAGPGMDPASAPPGAPARLEVKLQGRAAVLSWDPPPGAVRFHVFRSSAREVALPDDLGGRGRKGPLRVPGPFQELGMTSQPFFRDPNAGDGGPYLYYVTAEDQRGQTSTPSNMSAAISPSARPSTGQMPQDPDQFTSRTP